jgi:hypothetical protein
MGGDNMKRWILPAVAVGTAVFLMTRQGRDLQDRIASNLNDWCDDLIRSNRNVQDKLAQLQSALEHFNRAMREVTD